MLVASATALWASPVQASVVTLRSSQEILGTGPGQEYEYRTSKPYWSALALAPAPGTSFDIEFYDDATGDVFDTYTHDGTVDWVAIDSNKRPFHFYRARPIDGGRLDPYIIELAAGSAQLPGHPYGSPESVDFMWSEHDIVRIWDTYIPAGKRISITAVGEGDIALFLLKSGSTARTQILSSSPSFNLQPAARSDFGDAGDGEAFSYTSSKSEWYGVMLIKKPDPFASNAGSYSIWRWDL